MAVPPRQLTPDGLRAALDRALREVAPAEDQDLASIDTLSKLLAQGADGSPSLDTIGQQLAADPALSALIQRLGGQHVMASGTLIDFGQGAQIGTVTIGDVASGNIVKITVPILLPEQAYDTRGLSNPYLGLRAFTHDDQERYAGRGQLITRAVEQLTAPGAQLALLVVTGASGSGKSSFVQAGLVPALEQHYERRGLRVRWAVFRPSDQPLARLADALLQIGFTRAEADPVVDGATLAALAATRDQQVSVLVIDQLEEIFSQPGPALRDGLLRILASLPETAGRHLHIILTLRSDFLHELAEWRELEDAFRTQIIVRAMSREELGEAISRPVQRCSPERRLEAALLERLVADAAGQATYLPLLQVTLEDLWRRGSLTLGAYRGLTDAIRERAEAVYTFADYDGGRQRPRPAAEQAACVAIFLDLVEVSLDDNVRRDVRRPREAGDLSRGDPQVARLIDDLCAARLLSKDAVTRDGQAVQVVEIIHESLIANWDRLQRTIAERRQTLQQRVRFELALAEWESRQRADAYCLSGVRLAEARALDQAGDVALRGAAARELLRRSVAHQEARQRRAVITAWSAAAVLCALLLGMGFAFWTANRRSIVAESHRLALAARSEADAPETALLLASEAVLRDSNRETRQALHSALARSTWHPTVLAVPGAATSGEQGLNSAVFSPDEQHILTVSENGTVRIWDARGALLGELQGHEGAVLSASFSPDGRRIVTASADGTARLWGADGALLATLAGHTEQVNSAAFSPDGQRIVTASDDDTARLWALDGTPLATLAGHSDDVLTATFSAVGEHIVTSSFDCTARLWDGDGQELVILEHDYGVQRAEFSPDGQRVITAAEDYTARVWDLEGEELLRLEHTDVLYSARFSGDGRRIVTASQDGTARLWDAAGTQVALLTGHTSQVLDAVFSADSRRVLTMARDGSARLWGADDGAPLAILQGHTSEVVGAAFSGDGQRIVTASKDGTARVWQADGVPLPVMRHDDAVLGAAFSRDGRRIVTASFDRTARVWDSDGAPLARLAHDWDVNTAAFSPDGERIVTASFDELARVWDAQGTLLVTLEGHDDTVSSAAFSPDGRLIVTSSDDDTARLWDLSGELLTTLEHDADVQYAGFSPDGQRIVTGSDGAARIWGVDGALIATIPVSDWVNEAAFSPDGALVALAVGDQTSQLWRVEGASATLVRTLRGHTDLVGSVGFSPDGRLLLTTSPDKSLRVWQVHDGAELFTFRFDTAVRDAVYSPDGTRVLVALADGTARVFPVGEGDMLAAAACQVGRGLTPEESERFAVGSPGFVFGQRRCPPQYSWGE